MKKALCMLSMLSILVCALCSKQVPTPAKSQFHPEISAYTTGQISCLAPIRIVLTDQLIQPEQIGAAIEPSPFSFKPKIKGVVVWANDRTVEFRPAERLPQAQQFEAKFSLRDIMIVEKGQEEFAFTFSTVKQAIELRLEGLSYDDHDQLNRQRLTGAIELADEQDLSDVERILSAKKDAKTCTITWLEQQDNRKFRFAVTGIPREEKNSQLTLKWDGAPIGVDDKGEIDIEVPGLETFSILNARAVRGDREYVELRFSDPIRPKQELNGLITIENHPNTHFAITENVIAVYSASPFVGDVQVTVSPGISNAMGRKIATESTWTVTFEEFKPQVRFIGDGAILPTSHGLTIPIETVNLRAITVSAMLINDQKIPQFLQVNDLKGDQELERVGQIVWRKVVNLDPAPNRLNQWIRYGMDISPLVEKNRSGIFRLYLSFQKQHIACQCPETAAIEQSADNVDPWEDDRLQETRYYYGENYDEYWTNRKNPCHPAYYLQWYDHDIQATQNFMISDLALIAKRGGNDSLFVAVTDIKSTEPMANVSLQVLDFQQNIVGTGSTNGEGLSIIKTSKKPFLLIARAGNQSNYLKLNDGASLPLGHFDVSGEAVSRGTRGFIYGERGVWRPGDPIYLTFILLSDGHIPADHPVRFDLFNPRGQLVETRTTTSSMNGFYTFQTKTESNAPTGDWFATVQVGGVTFSKSLKIETVMPNRLKISLDMHDKEELVAGDISGTLSAAWLHGATAKALDADIELKLTPMQTTWIKFADYSFDDPAIAFDFESQQIFKGTLDQKGSATFSKRIAPTEAPGKLQARFTTRVFEPGGAFSTDYFNLPFHPFRHYIGLSLPDAGNPEQIYSDSTITIRLVRVTANGVPTGDGGVEIKLYKIDWRWWWEKEGGESLADYIAERSFRPQQIDTLTLSNGAGQWPLRIDQPAWGRYFLHVRDLKGEHSSGKIFYIQDRDWWRSGGEEAPGGVSVLTLAADKEEYQIGDMVNLTIPTAAAGRGLLSIENGTRILRTDWFTVDGQKRYSFRVTADMAPTVYAHVSLLQPHLQANNDLPIRLYGIIPIHIINRASVLEPQIVCDDVFEPENSVLVRVREKSSAPMTYTLAVVDEGLLDLTRFRTPNPWDHFYQRQALGVKTWDIYSLVAGAFGGKLDKLLAIGGGDKVEVESQRKANRFPPMVRFYGPFELKKGGTNSHEVDIPQYIGSVRIMLVAGQAKSFGAAEKTVPIRKPLMVLGTLPRVLSVNESVNLPVAVFADDKIKDVRVTLKAHGAAQLDGDQEKAVQFTDKGDQLVTFALKCDAVAGMAKIDISAQSGAEKATQTIEIDVRNPMHAVVDVADALLEGGQTWRKEVELPGTPGTNHVTLEVSRIPPMNLHKRLDFLIQYPYGCIEQTTSAAFPQLYLSKLVSLPQEEQRQIQQNVTAGIDRLRHFQTSDGGFSYWPGESTAQEWVSNYAGHFVIEAKLAGYNVPATLLDQWKTFQTRKARAWVTGGENSELTQAYRLYTLALAGQPDLGSMNRLKERPNLPTTAQWRLAAAYKLAGLDDAARSLAKGDIALPVYRELSNTYGSDIRDKAMILETLTLLQDRARAEKIVKELSEALSSDRWMSTQTTAFALIAIARYAGLSGAAQSSYTFSYSWMNGPRQQITASAPVVQQSLVVEQDSMAIIALKNEGKDILYPRLIMRGIPRLGSEKDASNGLACTVAYLDKNGQAVDISSLVQGTDIVAQVTVKNTGVIGKYDEIALAHLVPSGWEIHNERLAGSEDTALLDYQDIRDDRVYSFFDLNQGESKVIRLLLNASYAGMFYQPPISVAAMYDDKINARIKGQWITVTTPGE